MQVATIAWFEADSVCGSHSVAIPIVLVLPYIFRFFQCLRQYKDTREKTSLLNGKYLWWHMFIYMLILWYKCVLATVCLSPLPFAPHRMCGLRCIEVNEIRLIFFEDGIAIELVHSDLRVSYANHVSYASFYMKQNEKVMP